MKNLFKICFIILLSFSPLLSNADDKVKIGFYLDGIDQLEFKDNMLAIKAWFNILAKEVGEEIDIIYYSELLKLAKDFKTHKIEYVSINLYHYLRTKEHFDNYISEYWSIRKGKDKLDSYLIIVHEDSKIDSLKKLSNKTIAIKNKNYLDTLFFNKELSKEKDIDIKGNLKTVKNFSRAILDVFFKKYDACIVPKYSFELSSELNPILNKKLKVLSSSGPIFLPVIAFFHKDTKQILKDKFERSVINMKNTVAGRNIFNLFKMKELYKVEKAVVLKQKQYFDEYIQLLNR